MSESLFETLQGDLSLFKMFAGGWKGYSLVSSLKSLQIEESEGNH